MDAIARLLRPRSIAVVGASADATKTAGLPIAYLQKHGFAGEIYPVNPRSESIGTLKCYPDVAALPAAPDVGIVLLGSGRAGQAVRALAERGTAAAIVVASGFREAGPDGERLQDELKVAAGAMRLLGPNTIGLVNLTDKIMLAASGALELDGLPAGRIAVVSQSGGILGSLLSRAAGRGVGFSKLVSTGNEADLEAADFIAHLADDEATAVIALYIEGVRQPDRFRAAAEAAARSGKPLVVFKVGRSEAGRRSALSHTGALAGTDQMYGALFKQVGAIRVATFAELLEVPTALAAGRALRGHRVAILTSSGGAGTLIADSCGLAGFETPPPDAATAERIGALLGSGEAAPDRNPVDLTLAGAKPEVLLAALGALLESPSYDAVIAVAGSSALARPGPVADAISDRVQGGVKPLLAYVSPYAPHLVRLLNERGVPAFDAPESCAAALTALARHASAARRTRPEVAAPRPPNPAALTGLSGPLDEVEAKRLFGAFGIPSVREIELRTSAEAEAAARELGGRIVLKIRTRQIAHKTEVGGVAIGVAAQDAARRCEEMRAAVKTSAGLEPEGFLAQELVVNGVELILGFARDPQLGPAVLLGIGGITTELLDDTAIRLLPIDRQDAQEMIGDLKSAAVLKGFRGRPRGDATALAAAILAFADMIVGLGERLVEAEINPLFVLPEGEGVRAADGMVVLR